MTLLEAGARGFDPLGFRHHRMALRLTVITPLGHQEERASCYQRYHRRVRDDRRPRIGQLTILRSDRDPARNYLNRQLPLASQCSDDACGSRPICRSFLRPQEG